MSKENSVQTYPTKESKSLNKAQKEKTDLFPGVP